jgi:hypothetical protein
MTATNISQKKVELTEELKAAFGNVQTSAPNETKKVPIMSYSNGQVYIGLKAVSTFDTKTGTYREPQPRITASFGGHFVELPLSAKFWQSFSDFTVKMAEALEGIEINVTNVYDDVDNAKKLMAGFRGQ